MLPKEGQMPRVENISCILPETSQLGGLFLGNVFGAQNAEILKEYSIRAVITTSAQTNISYKKEDIPFHLVFQGHDKEDYYISQHLNECIHFIQQNRKFTNVLVHCYAGVSRSSAVIAGYLMYKYRWPLDKTLAFLKFKRIVVKPNDGFMRQLKEVESKLNINGSQPKIPSAEVPVSRAHKILHPHHRSETQQINHQRPSSTRQIPLPEKPASPPLREMMSQQFGSNPHLTSRQSMNPDYMGHTNYQQRQIRQRGSQKGHSLSGKELNHTRHNQVPIPRILTRKSQYNPKPEAVQQSDRNRKSIYNDYMLSPGIKPTSPKYAPSKNTMGMGQMNSSGSHFYGGFKYQPQPNSYRDNRTETTVYSTNYSRRQFQNNEKSKTGSRCLIRPRDLPGYRNY